MGEPHREGWGAAGMTASSALIYRFEYGQDLRVSLKAFLKAA